MRPASVLPIAVLLLATSSLAAAECAVCESLKPGDFIRVECRWRNVDVPPTASTCPYVEALDAKGKVVFRRRVTDRGRRGFMPDDPAVERWQLNYLIDGGVKPPPPDPEMSFTRLPSNTVAVAAKLSEKGDPAVRREIEITVEEAVLKSRGGIGKRPPLEWDRRELTDAELDAALAKREKARAEIFRAGGRTSMRMNGKPFFPCIYKSTKYESSMRGKIAGAFPRNGFNVFVVPFEVGGYDMPETKAIWRQDGSIDVSGIRLKLREFLRWNPKANLVLEPRFQAPRGWGKAHPSEIYRTAEGDYGHWFHSRIRAYGKSVEPPPKTNLSPTPSYASEAFADAKADALRRIVAGLENTPEGKTVVGVFCTGGTDGQWLDLFDNSVRPRQMADYSDVARRRFAEHLRTKYGTVEKMNAAYGGTSYGTFAEVRIPSREEFESERRPFYRIHGATPQSDYREFMAYVTVEMTLKSAAAVKESSDRRLLFGGYFPHGGLSGFPLFSQCASGSLMAARDMDFFAVVPGYLREFCDPIRFAAFDGTMACRGKLLVSELDLRSVDSNQFWGRWREPFWQETHSRATFRRKALHYAAEAIVHGGVYHAFDMDGGWFNSSADQASWKAVNEMTAAVRAEPFGDDEIALVSGEKYCNFYSSWQGRGLAYPLLEHIPKALQHGGVPWRAYLLDDVLADELARLPKVVLLSDTTTMTAADFAKFRSRHCRDGRTIVYFWRPGLFATDGAEIDKALGLMAAPKTAGKTITCDGAADDQLTSGLKGTFAATYVEHLIPEVAVVAGEGWMPLLYFEDTKTPGVSVRRNADCTEIHIALPGAITAQFCRNLAREAGFEPLVESDELSGCGSGIFYMVAQTSGVKRFRLPKDRRPSEVLAGPTFETAGNGLYSVKMKIGEIFVLAYR